jgi:hypothetical protein
MIRNALIPALAAALAASSAQALEKPPLCEALSDLAAAARQGGQPQRLAVLAAPAFACRAEAPAGRAFCAAATAAGESADALPWRLKSACLSTMAADPQVTTGAAPTDLPGRKRITRLTAKLGHGVRLDVSAAGPGRYELVVWAPK